MVSRREPPDLVGIPVADVVSSFSYHNFDAPDDTQGRHVESLVGHRPFPFHGGNSKMRRTET